MREASSSSRTSSPPARMYNSSAPVGSCFLSAQPETPHTLRLTRIRTEKERHTLPQARAQQARKQQSKARARSKRAAYQYKSASLVAVGCGCQG